MDLAEIEQQLREHPELKSQVIQMLKEHPLCTASKTTVGRANWEHFWRVSHGIDRETLELGKQAQAQQNRLSDEEVARVKEIEADPNWISRLKNPSKHRELVTERFRLLAGLDNDTE